MTRTLRCPHARVPRAATRLSSTLLLTLALAAPLHAGMSLTPAALGRGFTLTEFVGGFAGGGVGPLGIAFVPNGSVIAAGGDVFGLYGLPSHADGQVAGAPMAFYASSQPTGLAQIQTSGVWRFYMALATDVVEIDPRTGAVTRTVVGLPEPGLCLVPFPAGVGGPLAGHLFVTAGPRIWDVDPIADTATPFAVFSGGAFCFGAAFAPSGDTLYVGMMNTPGPGDGVVRALRVPGAAPLWDSPIHAQEAFVGISVGVGSLAGYVYANTWQGRVWEFGTPNGPHAGSDIVLAEGGGGHLVAADPDAPCPGGYPSLLLTQQDRILRLDPPGGGWFGAPTSSLARVSATATAAVAAEMPEIRIALAAPTPNPAMGHADVAFTIGREAHVDLAVYGVDGGRVCSLVRGRVAPGTHRVRWEGRDDTGRHAPGGVFFISLDVEGRRATRRLVLAR